MKSWSETIKLTAPLRDVCVPGAEDSPAGAAQAAWQRGYEQGRIDGQKELGEQLMKQRSELNDLMQGTLTSLRQSIPQVVRDTENMMVSLALEVARKLVAEMPISVPMVEAAVRDALEHVENSTNVTVRLHPADLELLQNAASPVLTATEGPTPFRFLSSTDVTRGGCLVETRFGTVDTRRETKFDLIKQSLAE